MSTSISAWAPQPRPPVIIGIYGVPGSGKSYLLDKLAEHIYTESTMRFTFYDSSDVIAGQVPGGLAAFRNLGDDEKERVREASIQHIAAECSSKGNAAVIAGHYSFWSGESPEPERVMTAADRRTYTHIIYLDTPPGLVWKYRDSDTSRQRRPVSVHHLHNWIGLEESELGKICHDDGILFTVIRSNLAEQTLRIATRRLKEFGSSISWYNYMFVMTRLRGFVKALEGDGQARLETAIVLDADRTLAPEDSGALFWKLAADAIPWAKEDTLRTLFGSEPGYSHRAFQQASLLYEDLADREMFDELCDRVASEITLYPEVRAFLLEATKHEHVAVIIATCGLANIWEMVLGRAGISDRVKVIGASGNVQQGVVSPEIKKEIVLDLQGLKGITTWVFGDSPVDVPMLRAADHPVVVVGDEQTRSKTMDKALSEAVEDGLEARQVLLPSTVSPRLDPTRLPISSLADPEFTASILRRHGTIDLVHATDKAASKLLATPTRDATISGPHLREAHHHMGWYLATEFVAERLGTEAYPIPHVQGGYTDGSRLKGEETALIVALMRGGEPMAQGVSSAFPAARFLHAKEPCDVTAERIREASAILLVDGVVNQGTTAVKFLRHIRRVDPRARVVIVAGVVQGQCVGRDGGNQFSRLAQDDEDLSLVALRISDNKYTGKGTVDTGNRLFNTTHLP